MTFSKTAKSDSLSESHGVKIGKSNTENFLGGKLQEAAGSAITIVIAVAETKQRFANLEMEEAFSGSAGTLATHISNAIGIPPNEA